MHNRSRRKRRQLLGALVAALLLVVLAGSLLSLKLGNQPTTRTGSGATHTPQTTPAHAPAPSPALAVAGPGSVYTLDPLTGKLKWKYQPPGATNTHGGASFDPNPVIVNNTLYAGYPNGVLYAINLQTNSVKWTLNTHKEPDSLLRPVADGNELYLSFDHKLCAVDTQAGKLKQCYALFSYPSALSHGIAYGVDPNGYDAAATAIFAFDLARNTKLWQKNIPVQGQGLQNLTVVDGTLYATSEVSYNKSSIPNALPNYIYAYNAQSGALLWQSKPVSQDLILKPPVISDGKVFFGAQDGVMGALNATNGHLLWKKSAPGCHVYPTPATANGMVYMGLSDCLGSPGNRLLALRTADGSQAWQHQIALYEGAQLLLYNGIIYTGAAHTASAIQASDGTELWHQSALDDTSFRSVDTPFALIS